jgi:nucleolar protein 56
MVRLKAFVPFISAENALDNANKISEGLLPDLLKSFLEQNLPKKRKNHSLGVAEEKLGSSIQDALEVPCQKSGVIQVGLNQIREGN